MPNGDRRRNRRQTVEKNLETRVVLYPRVSSSKQGTDDKVSLKDQEVEMRKLVAGLDNHTIIAVMPEIHTAEDLDERAVLGEIRAMAKRREFDKLVVYSMDRLTREVNALGFLMLEFTRRRVEVEFVSERGIDLNSQGGQMTRHFTALMAAAELYNIKRRTTMGKKGRLAKGLPLVNHRTPYGYNWKFETAPSGTVLRQGYVVNEEQAGVVKKIFALFLDGMKVRQIAVHLNNSGIPSYTGIQWSHPAVHRILSRRDYTGKGWRYTTRQIKTYDSEERRLVYQERRPEDEWYEISFPKLIEEEDWLATQTLLGENKKNSVRACPNPHDFLLRGGFAVCGCCGGSVSSTNIPATAYNGEKVRRPTYRCSKRSRTEGGCDNPVCVASGIVDDDVWAYVARWLDHPDLLTEALGARVSENPFTDQLETSALQLAELERRNSRLKKLMLSADTDDEAGEYQQDRQLVQRQIAEANDHRQRLLRQNELWEGDRLHYEFVADWARRFGSAAGNLNVDQKRKVLEGLGVRVVLLPKAMRPADGSTFRIQMNVLLPGDEHELESTSTGGCIHKTVLREWSKADLERMFSNAAA